jgi:hypothetical protein
MDEHIPARNRVAGLTEAIIVAAKREEDEKA